MVQAISAIRSYVSAVPPVAQQQRVNQIKLERNEVTDDLRNGKKTDMQAMSEKTALDAKLSDAKAQATPVNEVQEVKTANKSSVVTKPQDVQPANVKAMDMQQKGKELSKVEKEQVLDAQMKQMAINNQVLHGIAV